MLFLGTEKYPDENQYSKYLSEHGGYSNAYTDLEHTNYHFAVLSDHLEGALDMFAQFFVSPLFTSSATERELKAVDSEHAKNIQQDMWRGFQLSKTIANPDHPFNKFATGNYKTLWIQPREAGLDTREAVMAFHRDHYSANLMKMVVVTKYVLLWTLRRGAYVARVVVAVAP